MYIHIESFLDLFFSQHSQPLTALVLHSKTLLSCPDTFSSLFWGSNAKWWSDKTLSIKRVSQPLEILGLSGSVKTSEADSHPETAQRTWLDSEWKHVLHLQPPFTGMVSLKRCLGGKRHSHFNVLELTPALWKQTDYLSSLPISLWCHCVPKQEFGFCDV